MGTIFHTVSKRKFTTTAAPESVEPGFYSEPVEIHLSDDHGKLYGSGLSTLSYDEKYEAACDRWCDKTVLFVDYRRKGDLAKFYRVDREARGEFFLRHGRAEDAVPVFETRGGSEGWTEATDRSPVGFIFPSTGRTNEDGDLLDEFDPNARCGWVFVRFAD